MISKQAKSLLEFFFDKAKMPEISKNKVDKRKRKSIKTEENIEIVKRKRKNLDLRNQKSWKESREDLMAQSQKYEGSMKKIAKERKKTFFMSFNFRKIK